MKKTVGLPQENKATAPLSDHLIRGAVCLGTCQNLIKRSHGLVSITHQVTAVIDQQGVIKAAGQGQE